MLLLSVIIEYFSINEFKKYYDALHKILIEYLKCDQKSLKNLAIETVNKVATTGSAVKVLKKYKDLIPSLMGALDEDQEDLI